MTYAEKLKDHRWQECRNKILTRDGFRCVCCGNSNKVQVHHGYYAYDMEPWEYEHDTLWTLCDRCHSGVSYSMRQLKIDIGRMLPSFAAMSIMRQDAVNLSEALNQLYKMTPTSKGWPNE